MGMEQRQALEASFGRDALAERFSKLCGKALRFASRLTGQTQALSVSAAPSLRLLRAPLFCRTRAKKIEKVVHFGAFWCIWGAVDSFVRSALVACTPRTILYCTSRCITRKKSKSDAKRCKMMHLTNTCGPGIPLVAWALLTDLAVVESSAKEHER